MAYFNFDDMNTFEEFMNNLLHDSNECTENCEEFCMKNNDVKVSNKEYLNKIKNIKNKPMVIYGNIYRNCSVIKICENDDVVVLANTDECFLDNSIVIGSTTTFRLPIREYGKYACNCVTEDNYYDFWMPLSDFMNPNPINNKTCNDKCNECNKAKIYNINNKSTDKKIYKLKDLINEEEFLNKEKENSNINDKNCNNTIKLKKIANRYKNINTNKTESNEKINPNKEYINKNINNYKDNETKRPKPTRKTNFNECIEREKMLHRENATRQKCIIFNNKLKRLSSSVIPVELVNVITIDRRLMLTLNDPNGITDKLYIINRNNLPIGKYHCVGFDKDKNKIYFTNALIRNTTIKYIIGEEGIINIDIDELSRGSVTIKEVDEENSTKKSSEYKTNDNDSVKVHSLDGLFSEINKSSEKKVNDFADYVKVHSLDELFNKIDEAKNAKKDVKLCFEIDDDDAFDDLDDVISELLHSIMTDDNDEEDEDNND